MRKWCVRQNRVIVRFLGIALACLMLGSIFGMLPSTARAAGKFNIGDTVEVTTNLNVRTGPGTGYPEITDLDYPGYAPKGTLGEILSGPSSGNSYIWWKVDFGPGLYSGWSVEGGLKKVSQPPPPPAHVSPPKGATGVSITPTFKWNSVSNADYYGLYISEPPYGPSHLVYDNDAVYGTSLTLPSRILSPGVTYYWNMRSHNSAGWGGFSDSWYFTTTPPVDNIPTISITSPSNNQHFPYSTSGVTVQGTANDDHQVTLVQVRVNSGSWATASGTTSWSKSINLKVGANRIEAKAKDNNNQYSAIVSITVYREEQKLPSPPALISPGSSSSPGPTVNTLTPTFQWNSVSNADYYGLYIRDLEANKLVFDSQQRGIRITGMSYPLPSGILEHGKHYRWNMNSHNSAGWGSFSGCLYFQIPAQIQPPTVETRSATDITETTATLNGVVTDNGGASIIERRFDWGTTSSCSDDWTNSVTVSGNYFSYYLAGLNPGTTYYFRAWAKNSAGWSHGNVLSFRTPPATITDHQKQQEILNMVNNHRGSLPPELVLAIICQEGGEGAFHVDGWNYNYFYRESDGSWAQPTNGDGIMQVTTASGYHERSGPYTHDRDGYDHVINDGCGYLLENYNIYASYVQTTLHYNTGPNSLYIYLGRNWGDRNYLSRVAGHLSNFVPNTYGLQSPNLVDALNQGQNILKDYLDNRGIATGQSVDYYKPYQAQLDNDLHNIEHPDTIPPAVNAFSVEPDSVTLGNTFTISYTISDTGGSRLNRVELWRKNEAVDWKEIQRTSLVGAGDGPYSGSFSDAPFSTGTYWYGIHVVDNAGNWAPENLPIKVEVKTPMSEDPYIESITPVSGAPGAEVRIRGRNFDPSLIQQVTFGLKSAQVIEWSDTEIVVWVPYGEGTVDVAISPVPGQWSNSVPFTYNGPVIDTIYPASGEPGTPVRIKGKDFGFNRSGISPSYRVKLGKSLVTDIRSWTDTEIVAVAPSDYGTGFNDAKLALELVSLLVLRVDTETIIQTIREIAGEAIGDIASDILFNKIIRAIFPNRIEVDVSVTTPVESSNKVAFTYEVASVSAGRQHILTVLDDHRNSRPSDLLGGDIPTVDDIFGLLDAYFSS